MEKVKSIFTTFFDINSFSVRKLAIAAGENLLLQQV